MKMFATKFFAIELDFDKWKQIEFDGFSFVSRNIFTHVDAPAALRLNLVARRRSFNQWSDEI